MDVNILQEIGFTQAESKVYTKLNELGSSTAGPILKATGLQNSVVHLTLQRLIKKGFVSYITKNKTKIYSSADPTTLIEFLDKKRHKLDKFVEQLVLQRSNSSKEDVEIYEGFEGFKTAWYKLLKDAKKGDENLFFSFQPNNLVKKNPVLAEKTFNFLNENEKTRFEKGIIIKGIVPKELKDRLEKRDPKTLLYVGIPILKGITLCNDKVLFMPWKDKAFTILVNSQELSDSFKTYFYDVWDKYKN